MKKKTYDEENIKLKTAFGNKGKSCDRKARVNGIPIGQRKSSGETRAAEPAKSTIVGSKYSPRTGAARLTLMSNNTLQKTG